VLRGKKIAKDLVIVRFDGGICSQIAFWALAHEFKQRGCHVKYDLSWHEENGMDVLGRFSRHFELTRVFPTLEFEFATPEEVYLYRKRYNASNATLDTIDAPAYLGGYYERFPLLVRHRARLRALFNPDNGRLDEFNRGMLERINQSKTPCAVHVRRGDLAVYNEAYGHPLELDYFLKAIEKVRYVYPGATFFLFSDEPDWVRSELVPMIGTDVETVLVAGNHSDKGYLDLFLMSKCKAFIASQGSLAKYARLLSEEAHALIVEPASKRLFENVMTENVITLDDQNSQPDGTLCP